MVSHQSGHTLVELLVTLSVLGVGLGAVSAAHLHGARSASVAERAQEAMARAAAVLDSLVMAETASPGGEPGGSLRARWSVRPLGSGDAIDVTVVDAATGRVLAVLGGYRQSAAPLLLP